MGARMTIAALIVAAGKGERVGGGIPKQFAPLAGKALLAHSVDAFLGHPAIASVHVVIGQGQRTLAEAALAGRPVAGFITGGAERQDSVRTGLEAVAVTGASVVLIHDAARPFLCAVVIDRLIDALKGAEGAVPTLPVVDTLARSGRALGDVIDRKGLVRVQTPQAFRLAAVMTSHKHWNGGIATDDAQMVRAAGFSVVTVQGDPALEKITHPDDFAAAEAQFAATRSVRTGMGFDVHRLESGNDLWLCGVKVEHDRGLSGHSDADVALHAVVDALLGAAGEGDIGSHFSPDDPQWSGAASHLFVEHARNLIEARGGVIDHIDLTIICETPKIGPYRDTMRARLAELLCIEVGRTSVKATTTEGLGLTGRREGIAAQAVATIRI